MFRGSSLALAALLADRASGLSPCGSAYVPGADYKAGDLVATVVAGVPTNYKCQAGPQSLFCPQDAFAPGGMYTGSAWTLQGSCEPSTFTGAITPASAIVPATTTGCSPAYKAGTPYAGGALATATNGGVTRIYQCVGEPSNQFCGLAGFAPGADQYWKMAWTDKGPAAGACAPGTPVATSAPQCAQDAFLVARYAKQLCPAEINTKFKRIDNAAIQTYGLPFFKQRPYSAPISDDFDTNGKVALTWDQAISLCVTKCENDPGCDAVEVVESAVDYVLPTGNPSFRCEMVNTDLGPGAYVQAIPQDVLGACDCSVRSSVFQKIEAKVPSFEEVQCNINNSNQGLQAAIGCTLGALNDPATCGALLTDDWNKFYKPGVLCVAQNGGGAAIDACFACLLGTGTFRVSEVCPVDATDTTSVLRKHCPNECLVDKCETQLQTALLCLVGAPLMLGADGKSRGGQITGPDFACPPV